MTFTNSGSSTIVSDNNGKIGKCYKRASQNSGGLIQSVGTINLSGDISMFCWAYVVTAGSSANGLVSNHSHANNTGFGITVRQISSTDYRISCSTGNGSSRTYMTYYGTTNIKNAWHHLGLTYDNTAHQFKLWVDGVCELTQNYTNASRADVIRIFDWSTTNNTAVYQPACSLNDVRIYDHCLSAEEVKRISLGLVCHLPLNRNGFGVGNLLTNSNVMVSSSSYNLHDYYFVSGKAPAEGETVTIQMKATLASGKTYFGIYNSGGSCSPTQLNSTHLKNGIYTRTFPWKTTYTYQGNTYTVSNTYLRVYHMPNSVTATSTIDWIKLESGSEATTWSPNASDTTYVYDWTTEKDVSGLSHNGTKTGNFSYSRNTPTYGMSTIFNGTNAYISGASITAEAKTVSCWIKTALSKSNSQVAFTDLKSGLAIGLYNGGIIGVYSISGSTGSNCTLGSEYIENGWNHIVVVSTGTGTRDIYCNGVKLTPTTNNNWSGSVDGFTVGCRNGGSTYFNGQLSDLRLYATALSADDVKALYENRL